MTRMFRILSIALLALGVSAKFRIPLGTPPRQAEWEPASATDGPAIDGVAAAQDDGVQVTSMDKNGTGPEGTAKLTAAGKLEAFNKVDLGCGVDWQKSSTLGAQFKAGSDPFQVEGNVKTTPSDSNIAIMLVSGTAINSKINLVANTKGDVIMTITGNVALICNDTVQGGDYVINCVYKKV